MNPYAGTHRMTRWLADKSELSAVPRTQSHRFQHRSQAEGQSPCGKCDRSLFPPVPHAAGALPDFFRVRFFFFPIVLSAPPVLEQLQRSLARSVCSVDRCAPFAVQLRFVLRRRL